MRICFCETVIVVFLSMASISLAYECWRIGFTLIWSKIKMSEDKNGEKINVKNTGETFLTLTLTQILAYTLIFVFDIFSFDQSRVNLLVSIFSLFFFPFLFDSFCIQSRLCIKHAHTLFIFYVYMIRSFAFSW